jgi:hypothetical protein
MQSAQSINTRLALAQLGVENRAQATARLSGRGLVSLDELDSL